MWLPIHYEEIVQYGMMTWGVGKVINQGRCTEMFLWPFPKGSCRFPYVLFITFQPIILVPVYYLLFCVMLSLSLGTTRRLLMVLPLEVDLDLYLTTNFLDTFTDNPVIRYQPCWCYCGSCCHYCCWCYCPLNWCGPVYCYIYGYSWF